MELDRVFTELVVTSNFSFLQGASHPEEYVEKAAELKHPAIGISDTNTLAGIVRAHLRAQECRFPLLIGCRLVFTRRHAPDFPLVVYPLNHKGYSRLCTLLSDGNARAEKGSCLLHLEDFLPHQELFACIIIPPCETGLSDDFCAACRTLKDNEGQAKLLSLALSRSYESCEQRRQTAIIQLGRALSIPLIATNDVLYHAPERRPLQDVLTCIRNKCTIEQAGFRLRKNAERHLKPGREMLRLFRDLPEAVKRTAAVREMINFSLSELRYEYPSEICPAGESAISHLRELTYKGAKERYPAGLEPKLVRMIEEELTLIEELSYEKYFLTCHDIVRFARSRGILCQGRGSAANSIVCFCLGITAVDPEKIDLLFARFISKQRNEPPDIDIDFEHERREEVIQYIYQKYGRRRAALTAEVISYRHRSAVRDVGKALGLPLEVVDALAKSIHRWAECRMTDDDLREQGLDPADKTIRHTIELSSRLMGFPRHLSQHVGGFIISEHPLTELVPTLNAAMEDRTIIEWDKDDIEVLKMLKIDVLGLGMLTCIRKALEFVNARRSREGKETLELYKIPAEDPRVYDMVCAADTVGVFQIESRAQVSMLPRLKPRCFYDLVIEVALVRPGPIQGKMVHPYLRRRNGDETVNFPDEKVRRILGKTLGVPIFQEQAMRLAITLAGFSPDEAEQLRRTIAAWKRNNKSLEKLKERVMDGMLAHGYDVEFAETCLRQIQGFSEYGFPESHAASFALLVYASAWIKKYYPAEFAAALLNSQPMGFYAPSQIVTDARRHGVEVRPIDVNSSRWDCTVEKHEHGFALRLGMRLVRGLGREQADCIADTVGLHGAFQSVEALWRTAKRLFPVLQLSSLQKLARADALRSFGLHRHAALWQVYALPEDPRPLEVYLEAPGVRLPDAASPQISMFQDYRTTGLSLQAHPFSFLREKLNARGVRTAESLIAEGPEIRGKVVSAAGIAIFRQRPGTAKGVVFITLEDETGIVNIVVPPALFKAELKTILSSSCLLVRGAAQPLEKVMYIAARELTGLDHEVLKLRNVSLPSRSYSY